MTLREFSVEIVNGSRRDFKRWIPELSGGEQEHSSFPKGKEAMESLGSSASTGEGDTAFSPGVWLESWVQPSLEIELCNLEFF